MGVDFFYACLSEQRFVQDYFLPFFARQVFAIICSHNPFPDQGSDDSFTHTWINLSPLALVQKL